MATDANDVPLRDHLEATYRMTGEMPEELIAPPFPDALSHVWEWFIELTGARTSNGFGPNPISYGELDAWARLTGRAPAPMDITALRQVDSAYLSIRSAKVKDK